MLPLSGDFDPKTPYVIKRPKLVKIAQLKINIRLMSHNVRTQFSDS